MKRIITTTKLTLLLFILSSSFIVNFSFGQCEVFSSASEYEIYCGESVDLSAFGQAQGTVVLSEDFNTGGFGTGWSSTPGATNFTNPCSPGGVDGTTHAWMGDNTTVPRTLESAAYDLTTATAGVTICFDLLFASQGGNAPCEGPDEPDEGVYLEYSIDGGATWVTIHYFDPNGGNDPTLTSWNNWCFQVPAAAITTNTLFRWHQTADSGANYDHWGIDNVEIYQNDINSELEWLHDNYSYGVGNPGGVNPNSVSPTTTTTYTAQLTTGSGTTCTDDVTIVVLDPNFDVNIVAIPNPVCSGDCAQITGNADVIYDLGGPVNYENNEFALIVGNPALPAIPFVQPAQDGDVESSMNINVTGINQNNVTNGLITSVCINQYAITALLGGTVDLSNLEIILECPDGTTVNLVNVGDLSGSTISNMCFELGAPPVSTGTAPYSGTFAPAQSWAGLNGCSSNGVWNLTIQGNHSDFDLPVGGLTGWQINFDNPPDIQTPYYSWTPPGDVSDPTILNPQICPNSTTTYTLEVSNGIPGCLVHTEDITITVNPCTGCTPPVLDLDPISVCSPNDADLNNAVNATSDPANSTFYNTQTDAQNGTNPISNLVSTSGSFWVRAEDPLDPTCFDVFEVFVTITTVTFSTNITDENCGSLDGEITLTPNGGVAPYTYSINNGATFQGTPTFSNIAAGVYNVVITDDNGCEATGTVNVSNIGGPSINQITTTDPTCNGDCDGEITVIASGGTTPYSYQWFDNAGNPIGSNASLISNLCAGDYSVEVSDGAALCPVTSTAILVNPAVVDASFSLTDFCEGDANSATGISTPGGTFTFNPLPSDGSTIDATTGEISNGVGGTTYSVEYETSGTCPETSIETVEVIAAPAFTLSQVNPDCGSSNGEIIISNLTPNTVYDVIYNDGTVVGPLNLTSNAVGEINFNNLPAGSYTDFGLTSNGCTTIDNSIINLIENGAPTVSAPADLNICIGDDVTLTANNPDGAVISWNNGVDDAVPFTPSNSGTTVYTVTADLNGCTATDDVVVTVNALPTVDAGADQTICDGESVVLTGTGAQNYVWDNGVVDGISFVPSTTQTYSLVGTDANGCQNTDQVTITIEPAPTPVFEGDELVGCSPHTVEFMNTTGSGVNCSWDFGDGSQSNGCATVSHTYDTPGVYSVSLTIEYPTGCTGTSTITNYIEVTGPPNASFTADPQVTDINNTEVNFTNTSDEGVDYEWDFGDDSPNEFTIHPTHEFPDDEGDSYVVTLIASNGSDCADTARMVIKVDDVIIFYVPNSFTPDGDPFNQTFQPVFTAGYDPQDFHMVIYNRWGEVIFETYDANVGWNGKYADFGYVKDGTYVWTIEFQETMSDKRHYEQGHVNILR